MEDTVEIEDTKACPACAETIKTSARLCRFCGFSFGPIPQDDPTSRFNTRPLWIIVGAILVAAFVVVGGVVWASNNSKSSAEPTPSHTYTIHGFLSAPSCGGGYQISFANVEVRDQNDKLIGTATTSGDIGSWNCKVSFTSKVPKANFYQIKIGTHTGPDYSFSELDTQHWNVALTLN